MSPTRPHDDRFRRHRVRTIRPRGAVVRLAGTMLTSAFVASCATEPSHQAAALSPADYAWCNAAATLCTGWQGSEPFPAGDTSPVGRWIIPAGDGGGLLPRFVPGEPVIEGDLDDLH